MSSQFFKRSAGRSVIILVLLWVVMVAGAFWGANGYARAAVKDKISVGIKTKAVFDKPTFNVDTEKPETAVFSGNYENGKTVYLEIIDSNGNTTKYEIDVDSNGDWKLEQPLPPGDYRAKIKVKVNSGGESGYSDTINFTVSPIPTPVLSVDASVPEKATFSNTYPNGTRAFLYITRNSDGATYSFEIGIGSSGYWEFNKALDPGSYTAKISILNRWGQLSPFSSDVAFTIKAAPVVPTPGFIVNPEEPIKPEKLTDKLSETITDITQKAVEAAASATKAVRENSQAIQLATGLSAAASATPLILELGSLKDFLLLLRNLPSILLGFRKKRKEWGIVYDSITGKPVPFAAVNIYDVKTGKRLESKMTNKYGAYIFLVPEGEYKMDVEKRDYEFDPEVVTASANIFYSGSYIGQNLLYEKKDKVDLDIPIKPLHPEKKNFFQKNRMLDAFFTLLYYLGFAFSVFALVLYPVLWNYIIVSIYIVSGILRIFALEKVNWGSILSQSGKPEAFAVIRVFNATTNQLVARTISDEFGRYYLILDSGEYVVEIVGVSGENWKGIFKVDEKRAIKEKIRLNKKENPA